jgi:hypothetical protein
MATTRDTRSLDKVLFKLKKVKNFLKGWGFNLAGNRKKRKKEIENLIMELEEQEECGPLSSDLIMKRINLKVELFQIMDEEELHWFKRSHENWLLKGDNNTEFFHRVASGKRRKQTLFSLMDGDNRLAGTDMILNHATDYYKMLFGPRNGDTFELVPCLWPAEETVTSEENLMLTRSFQEEEIKLALFQMEKNKAAGPDGLPIEFYQRC